MADTNILGDATVITLPLQDDGTVIIKQSDWLTSCQKWILQPVTG